MNRPVELEQLLAMGFDEASGEAALEACGGNVQHATHLLFRNSYIPARTPAPVAPVPTAPAPAASPPTAPPLYPGGGGDPPPYPAGRPPPHPTDTGVTGAADAELEGGSQLAAARASVGREPIALLTELDGYDGLLEEIIGYLLPVDLAQLAMSSRRLAAVVGTHPISEKLLHTSFFDACRGADGGTNKMPARQMFKEAVSVKHLVRRYVHPAGHDPCPCGSGDEYCRCCQPAAAASGGGAAAAGGTREQQFAARRRVGVRGGTIQRSFSLPPVSDAAACQALDDTVHALSAAAAAAPNAGPLPFLGIRHRVGSLQNGGDILVGDFTFSEAMARLLEMPEAVGLTFACRDRVPDRSRRIQCYFKYTLQGVHDPNWQTYFIDRSAAVGGDAGRMSAQSQSLLLCAFEQRRNFAVTSRLTTANGPHSRQFRGRRCLDVNCGVCGGPGPFEPQPPAQPARWCTRCAGTLVSSLWDGRRCSCVATRGARLPLTLLSLSRARSVSTSLADLSTFSEMREALGELFELEVRTPDRLSDAVLRGVDVAVLDTTEGRSGLAAEEASALRRFVQGGGTAVVSAFSNWSRNGGYNRALVEWLGVAVTERAAFGRAIVTEIDARNEWVAAGVRTSGAAQPPLLPNQVGELLDRPFGPVRSMTNCGETGFRLTAEVARGGWCARLGPSLAFFPRRIAGSPQGDGQVLVVANYHWLADRRAWNGGRWNTPSNQALFLNLAASALAYQTSAASQDKTDRVAGS
eukprot:SAG22_NODE_748_length_7489_cov_39.991070_4_plen_749_part_00